MKKMLVFIGLGVFLLNLSCEGLFKPNLFVSGYVGAPEKVDLSKYLGSDGIDIAREIVNGDVILVSDYSTQSDRFIANINTNNYLSSSSADVVNAANAAKQADAELKKQLGFLLQYKMEIDKSGISETKAKEIQNEVSRVTEEAIKQFSSIQMQMSIADQLDQIVKAGQVSGALAVAQAAAKAAAALAAKHATDAAAAATSVATWKGFTGVADIGATQTLIEAAVTNTNTQKTAAATASATAQGTTTLSVAEQGRKDAEDAEVKARGFLLSALQNKSLIEALVKINLAAAKTAAHTAKLGADSAVTAAQAAVTPAVLAKKADPNATISAAATGAETDLASTKTAQSEADTADKAATASNDLKVVWAEKVKAEAAEVTAKDKSIDAQIKAKVALGFPGDRDHTTELQAIDAAIAAVNGKVTALQTKALAAKTTIDNNIAAISADPSYTAVMNNSSLPHAIKDYILNDLKVASAGALDNIKQMMIEAEIARQAEVVLLRAKTEANAPGVDFTKVAGLRMLADQQKQIILDAGAALNVFDAKPKTISLTTPLNTFCAVTLNCNFIATASSVPLYANSQGTLGSPANAHFLFYLGSSTSNSCSFVIGSNSGSCAIGPAPTYEIRATSSVTFVPNNAQYYLFTSSPVKFIRSDGVIYE